jgi:hypothetical protein
MLGFDAKVFNPGIRLKDVSLSLMKDVPSCAETSSPLNYGNSLQVRYLTFPQKMERLPPKYLTL